MKLDERIEKVKPYFILFNVSAEENAAYAVVKFPENWAIPDEAGLRESYKVQVAPMQNGLCFITETRNGVECVFDALDYVIEFNKRAEERKGLLIEKANELKNIFATEPIEKLKRLKFVFEESKPEKKAGKKSSPVTKKKEDETTVPTEESAGGENKETTPLMSFAENIVGE